MSEGQNEKKYTITPLPSSERLIAFAVGDREFGFRVPTTGDIERATRAYAMRCVVSGMQLETELLLGENGGRLWYQSRLEVGLLPRLKHDGTPVEAGEKAPDDWFETIDGKRVVSFSAVNDREFQAVCNHLNATVLGQKKSPGTGNSGSSVSNPRNG